MVYINKHACSEIHALKSTWNTSAQERTDRRCIVYRMNINDNTVRPISCTNSGKQMNVPRHVGCKSQMMGNDVNGGRCKSANLLELLPLLTGDAEVGRRGLICLRVLMPACPPAAQVFMFISLCLCQVRPLSRKRQRSALVHPSLRASQATPADKDESYTPPSPRLYNPDWDFFME